MATTKHTEANGEAGPAPLWLPGHRLGAGDWVELGLEPEEQVICAATFAWMVPLVVGNRVPMGDELFMEAATRAQLFACARHGIRRRVEALLDSCNDITDRAFAENRRERTDGEAWQRKLCRIRVLASERLLASPGCGWTARELAAVVNAWGEACREEDIPVALEPLLPEGERHPKRFSLPEGVAPDGLLAGDPRVRRELTLRCFVDGGANYLRRGAPKPREDGVGRDRLLKIFAGMPHGQVPGFMRKMATTAQAVLRRHAVDARGLSAREREHLVFARGILVQRHEREHNPLAAEQLATFKEEIYRAWCHALSRGGSIHRNRWILRLAVAWTVRAEQGLTQEEAASFLGLSERAMMNWMDGPVGLTKQKRTARSLKEAMARLVGSAHYVRGIGPWVDRELVYLLIQFLYQRQMTRPFAPVRRIHAHVQRHYPRPLTRGELLAGLETLVLRGLAGRGLTDDGEPAYRVLALSITPMAAGGEEERASQVLEVFRLLLEDQAWLDRSDEGTSEDYAGVLLFRERVEEVFQEVVEEIKSLLASEVELLPEPPENYPRSYHGSMLLTYEPAWQQARRRLPSLDGGP